MVIDKIALVLSIIGGINWGLIGFFRFDLVAYLFGGQTASASRVVYARAMNLDDPDIATPIGMGCKICERTTCPQRAFPFVGRPLDVRENESRFVPYPGKAEMLLTIK